MKHRGVGRTDDPIAQNIRAIVELAQKARDDRSAVDRVADAVARVAGSIPFLVFHAVWFASWIGWNATRFAFDPFPFSLLNLVVVLEAVFLTSVVLMTQNHMTRLGDRRAHLDLQVNLLAEQELTAMLHMLHGLCTKAGVHVAIRDERVEQLLAETNILAMAGALDRGLDAPLDT
ncbi:MAG TPA: DUF1003 domain-containing protein [Vicinamibacterales bacterium]